MSKKDNTFRICLNQAERPIVVDGAMGTLLHERGVPIDACFDELNLTDPGIIFKPALN